MTDTTQVRGRSRSRARPWLYFLLAYGWSWLVWSPPVLLGWEWGELRTLISFALGVGPLVAALVLVYRGRSAETPSRFWERVTDYRRISGGWWPVILLLPFALNLLVRLFPAGEVDEDASSLTVAGVLFTVLVFGFGASFAEELGWRGYALDALQGRFPALVASLIVGVFWGAWHLPLFLIEGSYQNELGLWSLDFWLFMLWTVLWSVLFTWIYNHTDRSILAMIVLHAMINVVGETVGVEGDQVYAQMALLTLLVVAVVVVSGWRTLADAPAVQRDRVHGS